MNDVIKAFEDLDNLITQENLLRFEYERKRDDINAKIVIARMQFKALIGVAAKRGPEETLSKSQRLIIPPRGSGPIPGSYDNPR